MLCNFISPDFVKGLNFYYMLNFLKSAPPAPRLPEDKIKAVYKRSRIQVFIAIYFGYMIYYFARMNFTFAKSSLISDLGFTNTQIGIIGAALGPAYGLSKLIMGSVSDKSNPKYFLAIGLILSGISNIILPNFANVAFMSVLMFLNGWFQGMGWGPCAKTMAYWFSNNERGVKMSSWNTSHNLGSALAASIALLGISIFGNFKGAFYFPGIIAIVGGIIYIFLAKDTPQSIGLPPIEEYRNDYSKKENSDNSNQNMSLKDIFFKYIFKNKLLWCISVANIFVYFIRYGVENWIPIFLKNERGFTMDNAKLAFTLFECAAIPGSIFIGWVSDRFFKGRRAPVGIFCLIGVTLLTLVYWRATNIYLIYTVIALIGAMVYGPVMLIGISAVDLVPKKAAGTASGVTGIFGYMGGQVLAELGLGFVVDKWGWNGGFIMIIACCILSIFFLSFTWNAHNIEEEQLTPSDGLAKA